MNTSSTLRLVLLISASIAFTSPALAQNETPPDSPAKAPGSKKKKTDPAPADAQPGSPPAGQPGAAPPAGQPGAPGAPPQPTGPGGVPLPGPAGPAAPPPNAPGAQGPLVPRGKGPWDYDLLVARVPPAEPMGGPSMGFAAPVDSKTFDRGGVACLCRDAKGRIVAAYQWFPQMNPSGFDKIALRTSTDEGKTWTAPKVVTVAGLPDGAARPCDPTLVLLPDGKLRLYFTSHLPNAKAATYSAISSGDDSTVFTFEPGERFAVSGEDVVDCTVARLGDTWHYFAPVWAADATRRLLAYHATSKDGLTFGAQPTLSLDAPAPPKGVGPKVKLAPHYKWLGCALTTADGKALRFIGTMAPGGLWSARSSNGSDWKLEDFPVKTGADPAAVELKDGSLLVIATGPARPGTPSAKPGAPAPQP
jgi:hypothetical protein